VSNVAFPIAAFVLMLRLYKEERESREDERTAWLTTLEQLNGRLDMLERNLEWRQAEFEDRMEQDRRDRGPYQ
jgi:hypothetical protein